ncbi:MAG: hypothetical protein E7543_02835 [Ruminococcaceae bacterium]|nr:hypothetical protein [Oscillospiraceae bacterium]
MKNKKIRRALKICIALILVPAIIYGLLYASMYISGFLQINKNIEYQDKHLEYLRTEYYSDSYIPCDEQSFTAFDLEKAFAEGVKINEIAVIGTHNSYQLLATPQKRALENVRSFLSSGEKGGNRNFEMDTFTEQLERGVRNLEIDIETVDDGGSVSFIVTHKPIDDNASSAYNFAKGLEEILLWSDNNPGHLPVYLLIEPKEKVDNINNMKSFSFEYALELDRTLREVLGDRLLTPGLVKGEFETFEEMRMADAWPTLSEASGKIIVLMHPCDVTEQYIEADTLISSQAMFPVLRFEDIDKSYASFILDNEPESAAEHNKKTVGEKNLMVRSRADNYPDFSDERYASADGCGSHIITTDYPPRTVRPQEHTYTFGGYTVKMVK